MSSARAGLYTASNIKLLCQGDRLRRTLVQLSVRPGKVIISSCSNGGDTHWQRRNFMTLDDILQDIHVLEQDLQTYERKYGVLSETFYESYVKGEEPADDAWVLDWSAWAGTYEVWLRRRAQYQDVMQKLKAQTPALSTIIGRTARRESIPVAV